MLKKNSCWCVCGYRSVLCPLHKDPPTITVSDRTWVDIDYAEVEKRVYDYLLNSKKLDPEDAKVLYENLWELYL